ncbi:hypothetical protein [Algoriphagus halophilus]|uniref:hypothetical protein n=1 Tax=Algoriphagus halophilus TaxID=226505 RepID=UPI00094131C4|nr:hypothetical protein [Algoriphagus halophilus]
MYTILTTILNEGVGILWFFGKKYRGLFLPGVGLFCYCDYGYAASPEAASNGMIIVQLLEKQEN